MKRIFYLVFILLITLTSCKNDAYEIKTDFPLNIPITIEPDATEQTSEESGYPFAVEKTIFLTDNDDVKDHLCNMVFAYFTGYSFNADGLEDGEILDTLKVTTIEGHEILAYKNYDNSGGGTDISLPSGAYSAIGNILLTEKKLTMTIHGTTNKASMDFDINLNLSIKVRAEEL